MFSYSTSVKIKRNFSAKKACIYRLFLNFQLNNTLHMRNMEAKNRSINTRQSAERTCPPHSKREYVTGKRPTRVVWVALFRFSQQEHR